jgi:hypothetical protein
MCSCQTEEERIILIGQKDYVDISILSYKHSKTDQLEKYTEIVSRNNLKKNHLLFSHKTLRLL